MLWRIRKLTIIGVLPSVTVPLTMMLILLWSSVCRLQYLQVLVSPMKLGNRRDRRLAPEQCPLQNNARYRWITFRSEPPTSVIPTGTPPTVYAVSLRPATRK